MNLCRSHLGWFGIVCLGWLITAAVGQEQQPEPTGEVELALRNPLGRPLIDAAVEILPQAREYDRGKKATIKTTTNDRGVARFSLAIGLNKVNIAVKGIGYGATGTFEVLEDKTARPSAPPLVPYGVIEGKVPKALLQPGAYVRRRDIETEDEFRAVCDDEGRFALLDVPCGVHWLRAFAGGKRLEIEAMVRAEPAQRVRAVFYKSFEFKPTVQPNSSPPPEKEDKVVWAAGVVRDERGRPVAGADVYAIASYHGGIRMAEMIRSVQTDDKGSWEIKGESGLSLFSGTLLAYKAGRPPAVLPLADPSSWKANATTEVARRNCEMILPDNGGALDVTVLSDGKPLANAPVRLSGDRGTQLYQPGDAVFSAPERAQIEPLLYPTATTNAEGTAHFQNLPPGVYSIYASSGDAKEEQAVRAGRLTSGSITHANCQGVAIRVGETKKYQLMVYPQPNRVRFRVLHPDGKPLSDRGSDNRRVDYEWGDVANDYGQSSSTPLNEKGEGSKHFDAPGLWRLAFRYRDSLAPSMMRSTPYYEAAAVVAASPLLEKEPIATLTAYRHEPGTLVVQLQNVNGKPARGYVIVAGPSAARPDMAGSTDESGLVRFEGVQVWEHEVEAHIRGMDRPDLGIDNAPFPEDKELIDQTVLFRQKVKTTNDHETQVTFRPTKVGYIRGVVHIPKNRKDAFYGLFCNGTYCNPGSTTEDFGSRYDSATGNFVIGPLPEGKATLQLYDGFWSTDSFLCASKELDVHYDRVAHIDFTPPEVKPQKETTEGIRGQVLLSDGKTPAAGATLAVFYPAPEFPRDRGETDVRGRIHMRETRSWTVDKPNGRPGSPDQPVIVAWLPGACGATISPLTDNKQPLKITLPPPLRIRGKVTVGGKAIDGRKNQFRVRAGYEGKGKIDALLSVDVSAEVDGRFELAGLTPGIYQIQAAMDGIWLSRGIRLRVKPDAGLPEALTLGIGEPGASSILELVYRDGKPARGRAAKVIRPEGSLTELLWPTEFTADGAGVIHIPPLEVGSHKVRVQGATEEQTLVIPSLFDAQNKSVKMRVVVE